MYPNGTPTSGIGNPYTGTNFTPLEVTRNIRNNYTSIDKESLTHSIGYQVALIQNFVNKRYLGRITDPVQDAYFTSGHFDCAIFGTLGAYEYQQLTSGLALIHKGSAMTVTTAEYYSPCYDMYWATFTATGLVFQSHTFNDVMYLTREIGSEEVVLQETYRSGIVIAATNSDTKNTYVTLSGTNINLKGDVTIPNEKRMLITNNEPIFPTYVNLTYTGVIAKKISGGGTESKSEVTKDHIKVYYYVPAPATYQTEMTPSGIFIYENTPGGTKHLNVTSTNIYATSSNGRFNISTMGSLFLDASYEITIESPNSSIKINYASGLILDAGLSYSLKIINLPTSKPADPNKVWNSGGYLCIS